MSKEELLQGIAPGMRLTWSFFEAIYGYEITNPGYAEMALSRLEEAGCGKAREYYREYVERYNGEQDAMLRKVANWYLNWIENKDETRRREDINSWREFFKKASKKELTQSLTKLSRSGVDVEQFVTKVLRVQ